jgi:hypothetical protein
LGFMIYTFNLFATVWRRKPVSKPTSLEAGQGAALEQEAVS